MFLRLLGNWKDWIEIRWQGSFKNCIIQRGKSFRVKAVRYSYAASRMCVWPRTQFDAHSTSSRATLLPPIVVSFRFSKLLAKFQYSVSRLSDPEKDLFPFFWSQKLPLLLFQSQKFFFDAKMINVASVYLFTTFVVLFPRMEGWIFCGSDAVTPTTWTARRQGWRLENGWWRRDRRHAERPPREPSSHTRGSQVVAYYRHAYVKTRGEPIPDERVCVYTTRIERQESRNNDDNARVTRDSRSARTIVR